MKDLVFKGESNQVLTNSLLVAEKFGKNHKHVLESIRELVRGCAEKSADPMFADLHTLTLRTDKNILCL